MRKSQPATARRRRRSRRALRIVHRQDDAAEAAAWENACETAPSAAEGAAARPPLRLVEDRPSSILIAGGDAGRRSALLAELSARLPAGTCFQEAEATWEVLERAASSRMVMLAGDLEGSSAESVIHLLGSRHPRLPVVALGAAISA